MGCDRDSAAYISWMWEQNTYKIEKKKSKRKRKKKHKVPVVG